MLKNAKQRLTYRRASQLVGLLVVLGIGYLWFSKTPISIFGVEIEDNHEPFLYMLGIVGALIVVVLTIFFPRLVSDESIFSDERAQVRIQKSRRENMLALMEEIWIKGFLDHVLNEMKAINLDIQLVEPEKVLHRLGKELRLPTTADIHQVFIELNRRLVILGEPGAGKTILLLQLLRELIAEARTDENKPIPVVFAVSSWAAGQLPFEDWFQRELREKYGISRRDAAELVQGEELLYLLDGLDEVAESLRDACVLALKKFVEEERPLVRYVLCSRRPEFQRLPTRLDLPAGEILVKPLQPKRIAEYLRDDEFVALRSLMRENSLIRQSFATVPFMLNTMAVVTRGVEKNALRLAVGPNKEEEKLRDYFLENYVHRRLVEQRDKRYHDFRQTRVYLKWLAEQLISHNQTDFYIENLQPDWLASPHLQKRYALLVRILVVLAFGLVFGLVFGMLGVRLWGEHLAGRAFALMLGLAGGFGFGMLNNPNEIEVSDQLSWKFRWSGMLVGFGFGMLVGFGSGLVGGLWVGLVFGLATGFTTRRTVQFRIRPNSGIRRSFSNFARVVLGIGLAGGLWVGLVFGLWVGLLGGLVSGLVFGQNNGGFTFIQHIVLRDQLTVAGHIPRWRYDRFLDYAAKLAILRRVGGGYRFVHDYMRQYLASAAFVPDPVTTTTSDIS